MSPAADMPLVPPRGLDALEVLVGRFESLWLQGRRPQLEAFLDGFERGALLLELVHAELELRLKGGEPARAEEYLRRFPELAADPAAARSLTEAEGRLRARVEAGPRPGENREGVPPLQGAAPTVTEVRPESPSPRGAPAEWPSLPGLEIVRELGHGGMGVVYLARQLSLRRLVAVKVLKPGAGAEAAARFRTEAEAAARLRHPHIAQVHEVGEHAGRPYLVMEYVAGGSLARRLGGTPWPVREAAELVRLLAEAVEYAHSQGVLHRDLTPGNVLLDGEGHPKVCDFGLAKLVAAGGPTHTEAILGTPSYMSPEQASGRSRGVGPPADVYGLGAVLYELLTTRPPFKGESSLDTLQQVLNDEPVPPRSLRPKLSRDLETICLKCLRKAPAERYARAADLADDLHRFLSGEPVKARPPSLARRAAGWVRHHRVASTLLAASLVFVIAGTLGTVGHIASLTDTLAGEQKAKQLAQEKGDEARANEARARNSEYAAQLRLASERLKLGDVFSLGQLLDRHIPRAGEIDRRGFEWHYLAQYRQDPPAEWQLYRGTIRWLSYSPDGTLLATAGAEGDRQYVIRVWDVATRARLWERNVKEAPYGAQPVAVFAHGHTPRLAVFDGGTVTLVSPASGKPLPESPLSVDFRIEAGAVSPDGDRLAVGGDCDITVLDLSGAKPSRKILQGSSGATLLAFASDGRTVFSQHRMGGGASKQWDTVTGEGRSLAGLPASDWYPWLMSPRGTLLVGKSRDGRVVLRDGRGLPHAFDDPIPKLPTTAVAVSQDDRTLLLGCEDGTLVFWDVYGAASPCRLRWQGHLLTAIAFSPGGKKITVGTSQGIIHEVAWPGRHAPDSLNPTQAVSGPAAFSPDGKTLAVTVNSCRVLLVDVRTGEVKVTLTLHPDSPDSLWFSPDGNTIAARDRGSHEVSLWDTATGKRRWRVPYTPCYCVALAADGRVYARAPDGIIHVFDGQTGKEQGKFSADAGPIDVFALSADGRTLASGSHAGDLSLWDCSGPRLPDKPFASRRVGPTNALAFLNDGATLAVACGSEPCVRIWRADGPDLKEAKPAVSLSRTAQLLEVPREEEAVVIQGRELNPMKWDLKTNCFRWNLPRLPGRHLFPSPDGTTFAVILSGGLCEIWDSRKWTARQLRGQAVQPLRSLAFTPDEQTLVTGSELPWGIVRTNLKSRFGFGKGESETRVLRSAGAGIRLWNPADGRERHTLTGPDFMEPPGLVALSPDGSTLAAGGLDGKVHLWDRRTHRYLRHFDAGPAASLTTLFELARQVIDASIQYPEGVRGLAFSPDGRLLVTVTNMGMVTVWDPSGERQVHRLTVDAKEAPWVGFSPGGDLAVSRGGRLELLDPRTGELRETIGDANDPPVVSGAFGGDHLVALAYRNHKIRVWDTTSGRELGLLVGHTHEVNTLAFSPDGKTLASGSSDRTVKLWSIPAMAEAASLEAHRGQVTCLAFNASGTILASGGMSDFSTEEVCLWRASPR
jgi:WD40 repeat protein